jgi:hypothetical protein
MPATRSPLHLQCAAVPAVCPIDQPTEVNDGSHRRSCASPIGLLVAAKV